LLFYNKIQLFFTSGKHTSRIMLDDDFEDFNDDFENESGDGEGEESPVEMYKKQIEEEFFRAIEKGEDFSVYLYLPHIFISDRVKEHLDTYLLEEAYRNMFVAQEEIDVIYDDSNISVVISDPEFKEKMLEQMLEHFVKIEEYEKCAKIKKELENMHH
jgi:hypothetical protein